MPGRSSAGPLTQGDKKRATSPLGALSAVSLAAGGSLCGSRALHCAPQLLSPSLPCAGSPIPPSHRERPFQLPGKEPVWQGQSALSTI